MRILTATEGKVYSNGESYGRVIYLSDRDSPDNWTELPEEDVKAEAEQEEADEHH